MGQGVVRQYQPVAHVRRAMFSVAIVAAVWLALVAPAGAQTDTNGLVQSTAVVDPTSCGHFETYKSAQAAFDEGSVSDPENLDADGDGIVCEDAFGVGDGEQTEDSVTCDDFASQAEAQAYYDDEATDLQRNIIDPDGDGQACEDAFDDDGTESPPVRDYETCGAFESQEDAQEALDTGTALYPEFLDGDGDGIACEEAFDTEDESETDASSEASTNAVTQLPSTGTGPATGEKASLPMLAGAAAVVMVLTALTVQILVAWGRA